MIRRPLVWVGFAYISGEIWASLGFPVFAGIMSGAVLMAFAGTYKRRLFKEWAFYMMPVFFLSGFVAFCRADVYPLLLEADEEISVSYYGVVTSCEVKENSTALTVKNARIRPYYEYNGEDTDDSWDSGRKIYEDAVSAGLLIYGKKDDGKAFRAGDIISGTGNIKMPEHASNPGQFDSAGYYHANGIDYICWPDSLEVTGHRKSYGSFLSEIRRAWMSVYDRCLTEKDAGIVKAIILGDKSAIDKDTKDLYQKSGIVHVLAISGLHISVIGMGLYNILKRLGAGLKTRTLIPGFIVLSYAVMTGFCPSAQRAAVMFLIRMGAVYLGESYDIYSAAALSALFIFIRQPLMVKQSGVLFSYAAVIALTLVWPCMKNMLPEKNRAADIIGPSAAVTLCTLPLTALYYGEVMPASLLLNIAVIPLTGLLVPLALAAGAAGAVSLRAGQFLGGSIHALTGLNEFLCRTAEKLPLSCIVTGVPFGWTVVLFYGAVAAFTALSLAEGDYLFGFKNIKLQSLKRHSFIILICCVVILIPFRRMMPLAAFLDVGQGECVFLRTPSGTSILFDGGSSSEKMTGEYRIMPFLTYYGESGVDYAFVSHGHEDHYSGIEELIKENMVGHLVLGKASEEDGACRKLAELACEHGTDVIFIEKGDEWSDGGWIFSCLYPAASVRCQDPNDMSLVLRVQAGSEVFLLTGDITENVEPEVAGELYGDVDVLSVPHHGSGASSTSAFLESAGAKTAVISCAKHNVYRHPSPDTVKRLEDAGMDIYFTMDDGAVIMTYKNGKFNIRSWND